MRRKKTVCATSSKRNLPAKGQMLGAAIRMWSKVLSCEVFLLEDRTSTISDAMLAAGGIVLHYDEVEFLKDKTLEELRAIAAAKRVFGKGSRIVGSRNLRQDELKEEEAEDEEGKSEAGSACSEEKEADNADDLIAAE